MGNRPILARVLVRMDKYNPRRFYVRDPEKLERWKMLARTELGKWTPGNGEKPHHGIRVEVLR